MTLFHLILSDGTSVMCCPSSLGQGARLPSQDPEPGPLSPRSRAPEPGPLRPRSLAHWVASPCTLPVAAAAPPSPVHSSAHCLSGTATRCILTVPGHPGPTSRPPTAAGLGHGPHGSVPHVHSALTSRRPGPRVRHEGCPRGRLPPHMGSPSPCTDDLLHRVRPAPRAG